IGGEVGDVLFAQRCRDRAHGRMLAIALLVFGEGGNDVAGALAGDHRHLVHFGEAGLITDDAVATHAHRDFFVAVLGIARYFSSLGRDRHASDSKGKHRGQQLVHFARTISWRFRFFRSTFDYMGALAASSVLAPKGSRNPRSMLSHFNHPFKDSLS